MPVYKQYKYDHRGWLEAVEDTLSDREIDLAQYTPPSGYTWEKPPAVQADEVPVWNGKAWEIRKLADYEPKVPTLEEVKADKLAELAQARWEQETGGLTLPDGTTIKTDRESQALLTGASLYALQNATATVEWKGANGWVTLTAQEIMQIATLVRNHVQAQFSKERDYAEKVNGCSTVAEVQAVSWGE